MQERIGRVRSSTVIAAILALIITSVAAGAAGDFLVLGESNDSGTSQTTLSNSGLGAAFTLRTTNQSSGATGIFGWSSSTASNSTRGVYGRADGPNSYGVYALQNGTVGSGAAIFADGGANAALDLRVDDDDLPPIKVNSDGKVTNLNSDQVDNWHFGCPSNTVFSQGKCFDTSTRGTATSIYAAADGCAGIIALGGHSWHLPAALELRATRGISGITLGGEWSSSEWHDDADGYEGFLVHDNGFLEPAGENTDAPYRCATYPYFPDFEFFLPLGATEPTESGEGGISE